MAAHEVRLDLADATEIIEVLGWIGEWFSQDNDNLAASFSRFVGNDAYNLEHLRGDLTASRFCSATTVNDSSDRPAVTTRGAVLANEHGRLVGPVPAIGYLTGAAQL